MGSDKSKSKSKSTSKLQAMIEAGHAIDDPSDAELASIGGQRITRSFVTKVIGQIAEVTAVLLAVGYGLGMLVIAGQLRDLGLHDTSVLTGFAHDDVLMKGFGAIISHVPTLATLVLLIGMAVNERVRVFIIDTVSPNAERAAHGQIWGRARVIALRSAFALVLTGILLTSVWWEGTAVLVAVYCYLLLALRHAWLRTSGALLWTALLGVIVIGVMSAFVHPKPPPLVELTTTKETVVKGGLLGAGQRGEWYVVQYDDDPTNGDDDGRLQIVSDKQVASLELAEPPQTRSKLLIERLLDR